MQIGVMRDKGSEWRSMHGLLKQGVLRFTPLIEAVLEPYLPRDDQDRPENPVEVMDKLAGNLRTLSRAGVRSWLDVGHLVGHFSDNDAAELLRRVERKLRGQGGLVVPVVRDGVTPQLLEAAVEWAQKEDSGICIRVFGVTGIADRAGRVADLIRDLPIRGEEMDLAIDAQDLPRVASHAELADLFPQHDRARTWAVLAGTFPDEITSLSPEVYEHHMERREWTAWTDELSAPASHRRPLFGDYATQPSRYSPSKPYQGSASVRYTAENEFVVLRGRGGGRNGTDYSQFIGHAIHLMDQPFFCDVEDTMGDDYVRKIASRLGGTGNATTWRVASLQRHIEVVSTQVEAFADALAW